MSPVVVAAVLFSAVLHVTWNAIVRHSADRVWTVGWVAVSTAMVCAPFLPFVGWPAKAWSFIAASALVHVVYIGLLGLAYKHKELSFAYPIARGTSPLLVTIGASIVAAERPTVAQAAGIGAIVVGIALIGLQPKAWDWHGLGIAAAVGAAIATFTTIDGIGARASGLPLQYNLWCFTLYGTLVLLTRFARRGRRALHGPPKSVAVAFAGGALSVGAYAIVTWAMVHAPLGAVSALRETSTLFGAVVGMTLLKERFSIQKVIGCVSIAAGAVMIGLR